MSTSNSVSSVPILPGGSNYPAFSSGSLSSRPQDPLQAPLNFPSLNLDVQKTSNKKKCRCFVLLKNFYSKLVLLFMRIFPCARFTHWKHVNEKVYLKQAAYYRDLENNEEVMSETLIKAYRKVGPKVQDYVPKAPTYGDHVNKTEYESLGAHYSPTSTVFRVKAPKAKKVTLVLYTKEGQVEREIPLKKGDKGIWSLEVADLKPGQNYHFKVNNTLKIDPFGLEQTYTHAKNYVPYSVLVDRNSYVWHDDVWMQKRAETDPQKKPVNIYEVHMSSWDKRDGQPINYRELAEKLAKHCKENGFTHVELMGALSHPMEKSWGYQVTGYFSPNHRMGSLDDFKYLVDHLHQQGIGVFLDWVPAHFANDPYSLLKFDGTRQYEMPGLIRRFSLRQHTYRWGTFFFDLRQKRNRDFLISSAHYWLKEMHVDGIRIDAVSPLTHLDHKKESKVFLRDLNNIIHNDFPGAVSMAEDLKGDKTTTTPVDQGGLGFDMRWNVGIAHHLLNFLHKPNTKEGLKHLKESAKCFLKEPGIVALCHDQLNTLNLEAACRSKNPAVTRARMRLIWCYLMTIPSKKLTFMGTELLDRPNWEELLQQKIGLSTGQAHQTGPQSQFTHWIRQLNTLYQTNEALHTIDQSGSDAEWLEQADNKRAFLAFRRKQTAEAKDSVLCLHNFSKKPIEGYFIALPNSCDPSYQPKVILNSNDGAFGGTNQNIAFRPCYGEHGNLIGHHVDIPSLCGLIIEEKTS